MKRLTVVILVGLVLVAITLTAFFLRGGQPESKPAQTKIDQHLYVTWDIMEFDKCVSAWIIVRFIDANAQFICVPQGKEVITGIPFDIPGAEWSRKHRKCTSQCILESIDNPDPAIRKIVSIASETELNFWQLDRWPDAQKCFYEVKTITDAAANPAECFEKTRPYFDHLYSRLKNGDLTISESNKKVIK
jgi:hypothetical protein